MKIADFGISKALSQTVGFANSFVGTVTYMSPERITGASYSFSSDIWSFGLTMMAVCWGRYPLDSNEGGYWGLMKCIHDDDPPALGPPFSENLCSLIDLCLRKKAEERATASQLLKHIFITSNVNTANRVQNLKAPTKRRSSEGAANLGRHIRNVMLEGQAEGNNGIVKAMPNQRYQSDEEEEEEDVKMQHLYRILDQLQNRAIELEDAMLGRQDSTMMGEGLLTLRGSCYNIDIQESKEEEGDEEEEEKADKVLEVNLNLPSLKGKDLDKWRHLAAQLQLPLDVVVIAAKQRLSDRFLKR